MATDDTGAVQRAALVHGDGAVLLGPRRDGDRLDTGRAVHYLVVDEPDGRQDRSCRPGAPG